MNQNINENENINEDLDLQNYRKSLMFYRECSACHYAQGMIFLGIGFFTAIRMQFIWQGLNYKQVIGMSFLSLIMSSLGVYKFTYAYQIFQLQGRIRKYEEYKLKTNTINYTNNSYNTNI